MRKYIYLMFEKIYNPYIRQAFNELIKSDFFSTEQLLKIQEKKLKNLLNHSVLYSPFYKEKLKNINLESINLDNINELPIITKKDLIEKNKLIQNNPFNEKLIKTETSGSTGEPLIFYRNKKWDAYHRASQFRGYYWHNINPWDKNLYFWGFNPTFSKKIKIKIIDFLMNRYRLFSFEEQELTKAIKFLKKSKYIEGYSSAIYELSLILDKKNIKYNNISMIKGTSEKIFDYYHEITKKVFNRKIISEYGSAEAGIIAFECPQGNMHINMENVIVEEIDGKIIVTNLNSFVFPIIRYELGDYIEISKEKCSCGRHSYIIKEIRGRIGSKIIGNNNIYPSLVLYYIFKNISLEKNIVLPYFGYQYKKGEIFLDVILPEEYKEKSEYIKRLILEEAFKYFNKNDIIIKINFVEKFKRKNKKIKDFESYINE